MKSRIYVEGGNRDDAISLAACREAFRRLFEKAGFEGRMPRIVACGGRQSAYRDFKVAHKKARDAEYVALLVDSEDSISDPEQPWEHLEKRPSDPMPRPNGATNDQALLMTTCMETWIVADRAALRAIYKNGLRESALPPPVNLERRDRHDVQDALTHATRGCSNVYEKGKRSFKTLEAVEPDRIRDYLPSFRRMERILSQKLTPDG